MPSHKGPMDVSHGTWHHKYVAGGGERVQNVLSEKVGENLPVIVLEIIIRVLHFLLSINFILE